VRGRRRRGREGGARPAGGKLLLGRLEQEGEALALGEEPGVIVAGQQLARVGGDRLGEMGAPLRGGRSTLGGGESGLEAGHIGEEGDGSQADEEGVDEEEGERGGAGRLKLTAEGGEGDAEAGAGGVGEGVGPEEIGEGVASVSGSGMEGEEGEEEAGLAGTEAIEDLVAADQAQPAQHLDLPLLVHAGWFAGGYPCPFAVMRRAGSDGSDDRFRRGRTAQPPGDRAAFSRMARRR
jgi:hypothetical protein